MDARRKRLSLIACILGTTVTTVDATVVNVALPAIRLDLGGGLAGQQWVANAYLLTLGSLLLVGGSLGDLFGERRVFMLGVAGFGATSILCAISPTVEVLVGARALQGVSGALLTPAGLAVIVATFAPDERGKAIGAWTAWGAIGTVIGPLVGGQIVDSASWRWIFAINVPLVLGTLLLIRRAMPADRPRPAGASRVDWAGGALCAGGLAGLTFGLIEQPLLGWSSPGVIGPFAAGLALLAAFVAHERRTPAPMLPLGLFSRRNFAIGNAETLLMYAGLGLLFFFLVLYLQQVADYSAVAAGTATLPVTVLMFALSRRFGALADRHGPRLFMGGGPLVAAAGPAMLTTLGRQVDYVTDLLPALVLFGLGLAMTVAPLTATVLADADESNAGIASGVNNAIARVASLIGTAAVGALVAAQFAGALEHRVGDAPLSPGGRHAVTEAKAAPLAPLDAVRVPAPERPRLERAVDDASAEAFHLAMGVAAALVALGGALAAVGIVNPRRRVAAEGCRGGQLAGAPLEAGERPREREPAAA